MQVFVPTVSATFDWNGSRRRWIKDKTTIEEGHPILKGREHLVKPIRLDFAAPAKQKKAAETGAEATS